MKREKLRSKRLSVVVSPPPQKRDTLRVFFLTRGGPSNRNLNRLCQSTESNSYFRRF